MPPLSNRAPGSSLSLVLIEPPTHVRGPVPGLSIRANGSSLSLVLIERPAHVRGPMPGLSIRAPGSSLPLVLIEPPAHVRGGCTPGNSRQRAAAERRACAKEKRTCAPGAERSERKSFLMKLFYKKVSTLPLTLLGAQRRKESSGNNAAFFPAGSAPRRRLLRAANARPRPSAWALKSRQWQLAIARAHREASARPRGLHPWQFAPKDGG